MNRYLLTVIEEEMDAAVGSVSATDPDYSQNGMVCRICISTYAMCVKNKFIIDG